MLAEALSSLPTVLNSDKLVVGLDTSDDCAVYKINDELCLIQSLDFFTPVVDDPFKYGQIGACNSLSDIYAMGADPLLALNIVCFPNCMNLEVLGEILKGGADKVQEAGCILAGGHTVQDDEPKYGLSVTGIGNPNKIWKNSSSQVGDILVTTKPLGVGIINTAAKGKLADKSHVEEAIKYMSTLNKYGKEAADGLEIHAATDVTGFGLCGHSLEMAEGAGLTIELDSAKLPILDGVKGYADLGLIPKGAYDNKRFVGNKVTIKDSVADYIKDVIFDPQTSGGLLFSVPETEVDSLIKNLHDRGQVGEVVGRVKEKAEHYIEVI